MDWPTYTTVLTWDEVLGVHENEWALVLTETFDDADEGDKINFMMVMRIELIEPSYLTRVCQVTEEVHLQKKQCVDQAWIVGKCVKL